jgi:hypothetical protein
MVEAPRPLVIYDPGDVVQSLIRNINEGHPQDSLLRAWEQLSPEAQRRTADAGGFTIVGRRLGPDEQW